MVIAVDLKYAFFLKKNKFHLRFMKIMTLIYLLNLIGLELQKILSFNPTEQQGEGSQTPSMTSAKDSVVSFLSRSQTTGTPTITHTEYPKSRYMER